MPLDDRKRKILEAIINDYILTAEPIGSRTIAKRYNLGISPATIRNEMADLEEMGYLEQPHTSAGRVPSDKGYRFYVNNIIEHYLNERYNNKFNIFNEMFAEIDEIVKKYARILSNMTNHTIVVKMPKINENTIKRVQIMPVDSNKIILLVITESGIIKNYLINLKENIDGSLFEFLNNLINNKVTGKREKEVNNDLKNEIKRESGNAKSIIDEITETIINGLKQMDETELYSEGTSNILNFPEYRDLIKARMFFDLIENKEIMNTILEPDDDLIDVTIGSENKFEEMKDLSIIKSTYKINGETVGTFGIIGPTRMNYKKLINEINTMSKELSRVLSYIYKDDKR
ncbi:heat-inducible transcriptional repressor HrcA [Thermoanaerobacterium sp. RBIITD]|uniref:heat-inducible transcriptional repressor HrcA n=1 Tax=Thermoanaerobacterium sp. RBIITD TaxID=1550240 RepID=UPI000BB74901|nr:heat-inducible transcriptional repressor HrcA [Thermoanaerobacterium sp. RBIITD]SNX55235.1 heat-inducible transcription repressor HrcA [Thermoanaerobacterium sp. RBIITD]